VITRLTGMVKGDKNPPPIKLPIPRNYDLENPPSRV
ncbi:hypothetical protein EZS27_022074, partial [termite gut metagenome]